MTDYIGTIVELETPKKSQSGTAWRPAACKVQEKGKDFIKTFRVWPYEGDEKSQSYAALEVANEAGLEVAISFTTTEQSNAKGKYKQHMIDSVDVAGGAAPAPVQQAAPAVPPQQAPQVAAPPPANGTTPFTANNALTLLGIIEGTIQDLNKVIAEFKSSASEAAWNETSG